MARKSPSTKTAQLLFRLSRATGTKEKLALAAELHGDTIAEQVVYHALNPYWTYGVLPRKIAEIRSLDAAKHIDAALTTQWERMRELLNRLITRALTGNDARKEVESWGDAAAILHRILSKDLRCGVHVATINDALGRAWIPTFDVALADEGFVIIGGKIVQSVDVVYPIWAEPKYDGIRMITVNPEDAPCQLFSRAGKEFENFPGIKKAIEDHTGLYNLMLDGEVFGATFDDATTVAHTKSGKDDSALMYRVWDCMQIDEFEQSKCERPLRQRQQILAEALKGANPIRIQQAPGCLLQDEQQLLQVFASLRAGGYEGLILKPLDAMYSFKRSKDWIKVKEMFTGEYKVVGFQRGKGKYAKTLGALVVDVDGTKVEVGSGFTDEQRKQIWDGQKDYAGKFVEVKFQEKTKVKPDGTGGSLRFPTFLRWRPDKE